MNEENPPLGPKALRQDEEMVSRFKVQAEKALEKYKLAKRLEAQHKMKQLALEQMETEGYSDAMGMYIIESGKLKRSFSEISTFTPSFGLKEGIMSWLKKLFKSMYIEKPFELKWSQFLCITLCLQISFTYTLKHMWLVYEWGAILLVYIIFGAFIAMPVYMILLFMGHYSRRSYMRFWDCVPLLKGVAYSIALSSIITELFSMTFAAISLNYVLEAILAPITPWHDCKFQHASRDCKSKSKIKPYNENCCIKGTADCTHLKWNATVYKYEAYDYFKKYQLRNNYSGFNTTLLPMRTIVTVGLLWIATLIMMLCGLRRIRGFMTVISIILLITIFIPWVLVTLYTSDYSMFAELKPDWMDLFNYEFWIEVCVHSLHRELAGDVLTFSSVSTPGISPTVDTIIIYAAKFVFLVFITVWLSISVSIIREKYLIMNSICLDLNSIPIFFGLFPELLSTLSIAKLAIMIYFFVIFFWCFAGSLYTLNSFVWSLLEEYPKLAKLKILICSVFCVGCFLLNLLILRTNLESIYETWIHNTCIVVKVALLFFTLLGIFLYSLNRIANDYHFTYGQKLHPLWLHGIKVAMLSIMVIVILRLTFAPIKKRLVDIVVILSVTLPTIIGAIIVVVKYKTGGASSVIAPDPSWGPTSFKKKVARSRFDAKRELRYRSAIQKCKHACLLNSSTLAAEIKYWNNKRKLAYEFDS
nr:sodium- and chloride-dependent glycine transporter 2-like [Onthophagus taurus]